MIITYSQRQLQKTLFPPIAIAGLLLSAACSGNDDVDDTADNPAEQETTEETPEDTNTETDAESEAQEDTDSSEAAPEDDAVTMAEVEDNDTADSCWAVMEGTVYDLTDWVDQHPGGGNRIEALCGTDATEAFEDQHGGQDAPEDQLSEFEIGSLET